jgi:predicted polyphosphate/ATP-dependent NAD kinase
MVKRILLGLDSMGIEKVYMMPDPTGIGTRALDRLGISMDVAFLDMTLENNQDDSTRAASMLCEMGVACIVVLGGDGTNRVVAKGCADTPLLSVATGTNNAFCYMVEGTLAGIAAGSVALEEFPADDVVRRVPRLEIWHDEQLLDIALVDVVVSTSEFVASRAIWEVSTLSEVFLTLAEPQNIGFSSLGGYLCPVSADAGEALYIAVGEGGQKVRAPIAPGLVRWVPVESYRTFRPGEKMRIRQSPAVVALDGEREITIGLGQSYHIRFSTEGPLVVDIDKALTCASKECLFLEEKPPVAEA